MALYRFEQLCRFLRFDDSRTRAERLRHDKLAPIRHVWILFLENLTTPYIPCKELTIDEQFLSTRNRCSFRQYIPSKPGKYGIKISVIAIWIRVQKKNTPQTALRLFERSNPTWNIHKSEKRKIFLKDLAMELAQKQLHNRCKTQINSTTKIAMDLIDFKIVPSVSRSRPTVQVNTLKRRCETCRTAKVDNKTTAVCDHCLTPTCTKHYLRTCEKCYFKKYNADADMDSDIGEDEDNIPTTSTANQNASKRQQRTSPI
ncbi:uncharacterized protein [Eurosta solidaginis]|uniref:uncharacterized protein n=1 Tax=Eurosta solidaginis TaxID=178769 RepID=UPI003530F5D1